MATPIAADSSAPIADHTTNSNNNTMTVIIGSAIIAALAAVVTIATVYNAHMIVTHGNTASMVANRITHTTLSDIVDSVIGVITSHVDVVMNTSLADMANTIRSAF